MLLEKLVNYIFQSYTLSRDVMKGEFTYLCVRYCKIEAKK